MEEQLEQAITIAWQGTGDPALRQQAMEYCNEVRNSDNGWQVCLSIVTSDKPREDAVRHFALQVIDFALGRLPLDQLAVINEQLFSYLQRVVATDTAPEANHMRNKLGETIAYLFIVSYSQQWTTFFDDLFGLMQGQNSEVGNPQAVDMYLRILKTIHEEIGDNLIARSREMTDRNNVIKDLVRERAMAKLAASWMTILQYYTANTTEPPSLGSEIVESTLKVIGGWVSWIDITLVVNPAYLTLIFNLLGDSTHRLAACDALCEILSKKMKPGEKLELISLLNPGSFIPQLTDGNSDDVEFDERVAKLCNIVGQELVRIIDGRMVLTSGVEASKEQCEQAEKYLIDLMPMIFGFLSNEYDDTSCQVFPCLGDYLAFIRKEAKRAKSKIQEEAPDSQFVAPQRHQILTAMLDKIILKSKYDETADWTGGEDESEGEFLELRTKLKGLQNAIAGIDQDLYREGVVSFVSNTLDGQYGKRWQDVEMGLYQLSVYTEVLKNGTLPTTRGVDNKATLALYDLVYKMVGSDIVTSVNHPSVHLYYMELAERHANLFVDPKKGGSVLRRVLEVFVSPLGVHTSNPRVQPRAWYLFCRFVKSVKSAVGEIAEQIFGSVQSLLTIQPNVQEDDQDDDHVFNSQLYLFETCGCLVGAVPDSEAEGLLQRIFQPIFTEIERHLQQGPLTAESVSLLQIHHGLLAIGTVVRGLAGNDIGLQKKLRQNEGVVRQVGNASQVILVTLETLAQFGVIRTSSRTAMSAMIPFLGVQALNEISRIIQALLESATPEEIGDLMGFLGQLSHSYKSEQAMFEMFTSLLSPLVTKITKCIDQTNAEAATGATDAVLQKETLRKAYLGFIFNVLNNDMGAIFISDNNAQAFTTVMQHVLAYSKDLTDTGSQKLALATLSKMFAVWGGGTVDKDPASVSNDSDVFCHGQKVAGFDDDQFIFDQYSGACWEWIGSSGFNSRDAQIRQSVGEAALLQKTVYERKGHLYTAYLVERYLPNLGCPPELSQEYGTNLANLTKKDFKKYFIDFVSRLS